MTRVDMYVGWGRDRILSQILLAPVTLQPSCLLIILLLGKNIFCNVLGPGEMIKSLTQQFAYLGAGRAVIRFRHFSGQV